MAKENTNNERLYRALEKKAVSACAKAINEGVTTTALTRELIDTIALDKALDLKNKSIETLQEMRSVFSAWQPNPLSAADPTTYKQHEELLVDCDEYKTALLSAIDKSIYLKQENRKKAVKGLETLKQKLEEVTRDIDYEQLTSSQKRKVIEIGDVVNNDNLYPEQKLEKLHNLVGDNPEKNLQLHVKKTNKGSSLERALTILVSALQSCVDTFKSWLSGSGQEKEKLHDFRDIMRADYAENDAAADNIQNTEDNNKDTDPPKSGPSRRGR